MITVRRTYPIALALALLLTLGLAAPATAGKYGKRVGVAKASGGYAAAVASGTARRPRAITIVVRASPRQRINAEWSVTCSKGFGAGSKSGNFGGRATRAKRIRLPMRRPDVCYVGASAQLNQGGRLKVSIFKR